MTSGIVTIGIMTSGILTSGRMKSGIMMICIIPSDIMANVMALLSRLSGSLPFILTLTISSKWLKFDQMLIFISKCSQAMPLYHAIYTWDTLFNQGSARTMQKYIFTLCLITEAANTETSPQSIILLNSINNNNKNIIGTIFRTTEHIFEFNLILINKLNFIHKHFYNKPRLMKLVP